MKKKHKRLAALTLTFLFILGLSFFFAKHKQPGVAVGIVGFSPLLAFVFAYAAYKCLNCINKRALTFAVPYSILLVLFSELTFCYVMENSISLTLTNVIAPLVVSPLIAVFVARFLAFFTQTSLIAKTAKFVQGREGGILSFFSKLNNIINHNPKKAFLILWSITFLCWLPYLFAFWPGIECNDVKIQTSWLITGGPIRAHHPVLHTLWMSLPMVASNELFGNYEVGFTFYIVTQMFVMSGILTAIIKIVGRWNSKVDLTLPLWILFTFFPVFPYWSVCATKDVIFSSLFALCFVCVADVAVNRKLDGRKHIALLFFLFLITALFRNNFVYALILFALVLLLFGRNLCVRRLRCTCFFGGICVVYFLIVGPLYSACGIVPIQSREAMCVPGQQLATVAKQAKDVTQEEIDFIAEYFPSYEKLNETLADPVKGAFNASAFEQDPLKFIKGYLKIGMRHPKIYVDAYFRLEINYFSPMGSNLKAEDPSSAVNAEFNHYTNLNKSEYIEIPVNSRAPILQKLIKHAISGTYKHGFLSYVPLLSQFYQCGFWLWVLLLLLTLAIYLRKKNISFCCVLILCYWFTVVLGPVYDFRYGLPLIECAPAIVGMFVYLKSQNKTLPN